ncbi:CRISPR-associated endoribonuclease Cas6 [Clostridium sp. NSJ-145]|uniref:CRISPR-associated endoribonuclease Cas6 n=1 Tax=Clostridium sp. NSJ-145 TaxID=2897777 RepID=UPI001E411436|nr:CRISPR-associated endoribonuclease Cas6 [Clostridium sp. NSJ-145]MCD2503222.1 CRISPR-associated endoribonuclease Cas6 [Clostridium sp. NSJ-145]MDY3359770.1 CRISPR-associated endoribonuclease Cas6 [Clostridium celatum]
MRFCLTLELKRNEFPTEYTSSILSYIKNALSKCNEGKYYDNFFGNNTQKDYCFSVILPKAKFDKNIINLEGNQIRILFSTGDSKKTGLILFNAFIAQKGKVYPLPNNNSMILRSITNQKQELIVNDRAIFKTTLGSGICVRDHNKEMNKDKYYVFDDKDFRDKLMIVVKNQVIKRGFTEDEANSIVINPIQCKKVVVKHYKRYIDISTGVFEIRGNNEILQYFYDEGIGSRSSSGFGMLELITQDLM